MKKFLIGLAAATLLSLQPIASHAVLFGLVNPTVTGEPYFFNNNGLGSGTFGTTPSPLPVEFTFLVPNSCAAVGVPIPALLTISGTGAGAFDGTTQNLAPYSFTIMAGATNLLSGTADNAALSQTVSNTASLTASAPTNTLVFTSDCLAFLAGTESATFSFSSTTPDVFSPDTDGQLIDMTYGGNGNFSADLIVEVPEPGVTGLLFSSCIGGGLLFARRRRAGTRK